LQRGFSVIKKGKTRSGGKKNQVTKKKGKIGDKGPWGAFAGKSPKIREGGNNDEKERQKNRGKGGEIKKRPFHKFLGMGPASGKKKRKAIPW